MKENEIINILVDGAGGDVGQGVLKSLRDSSLNLNIFASCISNSSSWLYNVDNSYIFPYVDDSNFIEFLIAFLNKHDISVYFPTVDSALMKIALNKDLIESKTNAVVFIDNLENISICDDKYLTVKFLEKHGFTYPSSVELLSTETVQNFIEKSSFPFVLKPKSGNGAKEIKIITNYDELLPYFGKSSWMLQEHLNIAEEITSGIYIGDDGEVKSTYILKRELRCGSTYKAERIIDTALEQHLIEIAKVMNMKYINIQAVYENGVLYPFEFNGRMSGTTGAMRSIYNVPENFIREKIFKEKVPKSKHKEKFYFARYYEEVLYTEKDIDLLEERSRN